MTRQLADAPLELCPLSAAAVTVSQPFVRVEFRITFLVIRNKLDRNETNRPEATSSRLTLRLAYQAASACTSSLLRLADTVIMSSFHNFIIFNHTSQCSMHFQPISKVLHRKPHRSTRRNRPTRVHPAQA